MDSNLKELLLSGEYIPFMESSILNKGNQSRIAKVLKKAKNGENISVVTIGGSITSGAWATEEKNKYAVRVKNWFVSNFPDITVNFQNAGISATPSIIGVHRVAEQVLSYDPDFVVVDFSANDTANDETYKTPYENLIRRILEYKTEPAVLSIIFGSSSNNKRNDNALSLHLPTILHYDIPCIDYFGSLWKYLDLGVIAWSDISPDTIHPNDAGHKMAANCINNYLSSVLCDLENIDSQNYSIPKNFVFNSDMFMNANFLKADNYSPDIVDNFEIANLHADKGERIMGWRCDEKGGTIVFNLENVSNVSVFVQKTAGNATADIYINDNLIISDINCDVPGDRVIRFCHTELFDTPRNACVKIIAKGVFGVGPLGVSYAE